MQDWSIDVVAVANPLRSVPGDAAYLRDVIAGISGPVVLVGHSYGGMVITEAAAGNDKVAGLVYVRAFAPEQGESAFELSNKFPGATLGQALIAYPVMAGGNEFAIRPDAFPHQFAADVPPAQAAVMSATQRPVTEIAVTAGLPTDAPAWKSIPSWFVFSDEGLRIPVALHRFMANQAGAKGVREVPGASHALSVSQPEAVTASIPESMDAAASRTPGSRSLPRSRSPRPWSSCSGLCVSGTSASRPRSNLVLFFLAAIGVHLRAHEHRHIITTVGCFLLATAALVASIAG